MSHSTHQPEDAPHAEPAAALLAEVSRIQLNLIRDGNFQRGFEDALEVCLKRTGSEYGFIGEVLRDLDGAPSLTMLAITDIAWDDWPQQTVESLKSQDLVLRRLDTLFGEVMTSGNPVIANDATNDPRAGGLPAGHPPFKSYLGIPVYAEGQLIGVISLANRPGGYGVGFIAQLEPLTTTIATMLVTQRLRTTQAHTAASLTEVDVRNRAMLKALPDTLFVTTREGCFIDVRSSGATPLMLPPQEFLGRGHREVLPAEACDAWDAAVERAFQTRKVQQFKYALPVANEVRWFENRVVVSDDDEVLTIARDITDQKTASKALEETRTQLNLILGQMPGGVWSLDKDLRFTTSVGRLVAELGLTQDQLVGHSLREFVDHDPRAPSIIEAHLNAINGTALHRELEFGGRFLDCVLEPVRDAAGNSSGCIGVAIDVTESRRAVQERQETESRLQAVLENVPDFISVLNREGTILFLNRFMPGFDRSLIGRTTVFDYQPPEEHEHVRSQMEAAFERGETVSYETIGRGRWDEWRSYITRIVPMQTSGDQPLVLMIANDITERKLAESERDRDYALLKGVFEGTAENIFAKDTAGRYLLVNDAMSRAHETTVDKIVGRTADELFPPETSEQIRVDDQLVLAEGQTIVVEREVPMPRGKRVMLLTKTPWRDASGNLIGLIGVCQDITNSRRAEETIAEQRILLAHVSRLSMMGQMVAMVSHEVAQPLSAITNYAATAKLLSARPQLDLAKIDMCLQAISTQAVRAGSILERIRAFGRRAEPKHEPIDLVTTIRESLRLLQYELKQRKTTVQLTSQQNELIVCSDTVELQQVIVNLVTNASEAMLELPPARREIEISCYLETAESRVIMEVIDNGPGIDLVRREMLFDAFHTSKISGLGMGLAICRRIMESHGGTIEATNSTDRGALFRCVLPAYQTAAE